ncbi:hypothetical protein POUND7_016505 [Theobroma cacao]
MHRRKMKLSLELACFIFLSALSFTLAASPSASTNSSAKCPMDLNYVTRIPWNSSVCRNFHPNSTSKTEIAKQNCCVSLLLVFGIGLAQHLKETSLFQLPNLPTSVSCLQDFQSKLNSLSLPGNLASLCFEPMQFVITPDLCAHIQTTQDWVAKLGESTALDQACRSDLSDLTACDTCLRAGNEVQTKLVSLDGNSNHSTDCFNFIVLYAAGIANKFGPESDGTVECAFALTLNKQSSSASERRSVLVFGLTGAGVALFVTFSLLGLYFWYEKKFTKKNNSGSDSNFYDLEEQESRPKLRPNTGSIWFKLHDLEKATDNFSQKNFIGRGGYGFVYKGVLPDGTVVAVKRIIESEFQGDEEFCNEVEIISNLKHRNLVPLRGCCMINGDENYDEGGSGRYLVYDYMPNGNLDDHLFPSKMENWAWSLVKAGKIEEALDRSLINNGDSVSSNPKAIMERFLQVGILCAHVMVALRPTILDALKMLEGDIEVPGIPDRPMPLGHPKFYGDGNAFSISPTLSGPQLCTGDMLRLFIHDAWNKRNQSSTASSIATKRGMWETGNTEHHEHAFLHRLKLVHWQKLGKWKSFACSFARASAENAGKIFWFIHCLRNHDGSPFKKLSATTVLSSRWVLVSYLADIF